MTSKQPEIFNLDRIETPLGTVLIVTDAGARCGRSTSWTMRRG